MAAEIGAILAAGGIEVTKLLLQMFMQSARYNGMTDDQMDALYEENKKFRQEHPAVDLPDV